MYRFVIPKFEEFSTLIINIFIYSSQKYLFELNCKENIIVSDLTLPHCLNICPALSSDFGLAVDNHLKNLNIALTKKTRINTKIINKSCTIFITYRGIAKAKSISQWNFCSTAVCPSRHSLEGVLLSDMTTSVWDLLHRKTDVNHQRFSLAVPRQYNNTCNPAFVGVITIIIINLKSLEAARFYNISSSMLIASWTMCLAL